MTPDEQDPVLGLMVSPGQGPTRTIDEVLAHFPAHTPDGSSW